MSRHYGMHLSIANFNVACSEAIRNASKEEWPFDDWFEYEGVLTTSGESSLAGGETEEEFAARLAKAVWKANGGFCKVEVAATCLEDLPHNYHTLDEEDFEEMIGQDGQFDGVDAAAKEASHG